MTDEEKRSVVGIHDEIGASQRKLALLLQSSVATAKTETMALVHMRKTLVLLGVAAETLAPLAKTWTHH